MNEKMATEDSGVSKDSSRYYEEIPITKDELHELRGSFTGNAGQ